jgi:hypothetical protein
MDTDLDRSAARLALAVGVVGLGSVVSLALFFAAQGRWTRRLPLLGIVAGIVMAIGFVVVPGIAMGLDDMDTAPGWVWVGFVGWLGVFFLYPIWSLWFGTILRRGAAGQSTEV